MKYLFLFIFTVVSLIQLQAQVRLLPTDIEGQDMQLKFDYDEHNRLIYMNVKFGEDDSSAFFSSECKFAYDENDLLQRVEVQTRHEFFLVENIIYNKNKISCTDSDSTTYTYYIDDENKLIRKEQFGHRLKSDIDFEYDAEGHLARKQESQKIGSTPKMTILNKDTQFEYENGVNKLFESVIYPKWFIQGLDYLVFLDCPKSIKHSIQWKNYYDDYAPDDIAERSVSGSLIYSVNEYNYPDLITVQEDKKEDDIIKILYRKVD